MTLRWAIGQLAHVLGGSLDGSLRTAPLYRSSPVSPIPQADFLNTVVVGRLRSTEPATPGPEDLLGVAKALELTAGRRRGPRFGPRPLDVDLLVFGERCSHRPELTLPHPRLGSRRFVLAPLADLCPDLRPPGADGTVRELLDRLGEAQEVEKVSWSA